MFWFSKVGPSVWVNGAASRSLDQAERKGFRSFGAGLRLESLKGRQDVDRFLLKNLISSGIMTYFGVYVRVGYTAWVQI